MKIIKGRNQLGDQPLNFKRRMYDIYMRHIMALNDLWVFGYGSLIWKPDFNADNIYSGYIIGRKRDFILYSYAYRGTAENPGLLLGLDVGGCCTGLLYHVPNHIRGDVADMLWHREMITIAYHPEMLTAHIGQKRLSCLCFTANRYHIQYARGLHLGEKIKIIKKAYGTKGSNRDYVLNTANALRHHHIHDSNIANLARELRDNHD